MRYVSRAAVLMLSLFILEGARGSILSWPNLALQPTVLEQDLTVCLGPGACNQMDNWRQVRTFRRGTKKFQIELRWRSETGIKADGFIWQISKQPFPSSFETDPAGVIGRGIVRKPIAKSTRRVAFYLDLTKVLEEVDPHDADAETSSHYLRVIPMASERPVTGPSNAIVISTDLPEQKPVKLIGALPSIYQVEILEYTGIRYPTKHWGCVIVDDFDPDVRKRLEEQMEWANLDADSASQSSAEEHLRWFNVGAEICPPSYKGEGERAWESFAEFALSAVSWPADTFEEIKQGVVDATLKTIPGNPPWKNELKKGLTLGLEMGLVALGVPPALPDLEQLTDEGLDYLIEVGAAEIGVSCDATCRETLGKGIKALGKEMVRNSQLNACVSEEEAHRYGAEPLCPPEGVHVRPDPESYKRPASLKIRVSRSSKAHAVSQEDLGTYHLYLTFPCTNATVKKRQIFSLTHDPNCSTIVFYDTGFYETFNSDLVDIKTPITGDLFEPIITQIPPLQLGQSIEMPFNLKPSDYWIPEHLEVIEKEFGAAKCYNDFDDLYHNGKLKVNAGIRCSTPGIIDVARWFSCGEAASIVVAADAQ